MGDQDAGTVHWLQPDPSAYDQNQVTWRTVQGGVTSGYIAGNQQPDLTVSLDGWSAKIGNNNVGSGSFLANIDPYFSGIYLQGTQAQLIRESAPHRNMLRQNLTAHNRICCWLHAMCSFR